MLEAHDLAARRGSLLLFEGLSVQVPPGTALVVSGRNGSGKTTLLRILAGVTRPAAGRVTWHGRDVARHDPSVRADICFAGHVPALKDELTATENLHALATLAGGGPDRSRCGARWPTSDSTRGATCRRARSPKGKGDASRSPG